MGFLIKNRKTINISITISCVVDVVIAFIVNILSQTPFTLLNTKNIVLGIILIILILALILCNIIINTQASDVRHKKLQKAFQQSGGYDVVATELKSCIQDGNIKKLKNLKKMVKIIEQ